MRRYLALMASDFHSELGKAYVAMENSSNPWGASQEDRMKWSEDLEFHVPLLDETNKEEVEYLYCPLFFSIFYISPGHCPLL